MFWNNHKRIREVIAQLKQSKGMSEDEGQIVKKLVKDLRKDQDKLKDEIKRIRSHLKDFDKASRGVSRDIQNHRGNRGISWGRSGLSTGMRNRLNPMKRKLIAMMEHWVAVDRLVREAAKTYGRDL